MRLAIEQNGTAFPHVSAGMPQSDPTVETDQLLRSGIEAAQAGDRSNAREVLLRAAELSPNCEDAWMWLASISEYPEELLAFLNNALAINPESAKALEWHAATRKLRQDICRASGHCPSAGIFGKRKSGRQRSAPPRR